LKALKVISWWQWFCYFSFWCTCYDLYLLFVPLTEWLDGCLVITSNQEVSLTCQKLKMGRQPEVNTLFKRCNIINQGACLLKYSLNATKTSYKQFNTFINCIYFVICEGGYSCQNCREKQAEWITHADPIDRLN
jgi:hypothetical protein